MFGRDAGGGRVCVEMRGEERRGVIGVSDVCEGLHALLGVFEVGGVGWLNKTEVVMVGTEMSLILVGLVGCI